MDVVGFNNKRISSGIFEYSGEDNSGKKVWIGIICENSHYFTMSNLENYIKTLNYDYYIAILTKTKKSKKIIPNCEIIDGTYYLIKNLRKTHNVKGIKIRVLPKDEIENYLKLLYIFNDSTFPKIIETDQTCVWYNAKPGDILEVILPSMIASGYSAKFIKVIEEPI